MMMWNEFSFCNCHKLVSTCVQHVTNNSSTGDFIFFYLFHPTCYYHNINLPTAAWSYKLLFH